MKALFTLDDELGDVERVERAATLAHVHDTLRTRFATLLGDECFRMLLLRSAAITAIDFPALEVAGGAVEQQRTNLRGRLQTASFGAVGALFATLLALLTNLIGERLATLVFVPAALR